MIIEALKDDQTPNFTEKRDIQKKFIFDSKDGQISRSYIFGYEKDNPSYNYLKSEIFGEWNTETNEETVYTQNLSRAKTYFQQQVSELTFDQLEVLYKKITQNLLFNILTISNEVDVCVAFETMNNRGKPLSVLELLKNRLIYLSLKFDQPDFERDRLRKAVNDCWRSLYHNLGRNKDRPLNDDRFLAAHYMIYFDSIIADRRRVYSGQIKSGARYLGHIEDLLEKKFISRNISESSPEESRITLSDVYKYVSSLQDSVELWYTIFNPNESNIPDQLKVSLDRLIRLGVATEGYLPLILIVLQRIRSDKKRLAFLRQLERFIFVALLHSPYFSLPFNAMYDPVATKMAMEFRAEKSPDVTLDKIVKYFEEQILKIISDTRIKDIVDKSRSNGFYEWPIIKYFCMNIMPIFKVSRKQTELRLTGLSSRKIRLIMFLLSIFGHNRLVIQLGSRTLAI